ncbi:GIY-YIG nuclease family protein [Patescibacteria group bacterium]|nr:GIY-YIG nuclease family protein [Patescibacteria group bacterium]MBU1885593.1 GIY-YIG nuclease family protein [Patescibacteria group bacterium]
MLPSSPGVYWFLDAKNKVLYVGKAKNLKNRLRSYTHFTDLTPKIKRLVTIATAVSYQILDSELEALLIEAELIRLHQPKFNSLLKDDKTPLYIQITDEIFPRVLTVRKKDLDHSQLKGSILGPFPSSSKVREVLGIARKIFPWCNQTRGQNQTQSKNKQACFYYHLEQCPGVCIDKVSIADYQEQISQLIIFLKGQKKTILKKLQKQLKTTIENEKFEQAALIRDKIQLIKEVTQKKYPLKPTLTLPNLTNNELNETLLHLQKILSTYLKIPKNYPLNRIEGYDVSNTSGKLASVSMVTFINGQPATDQYRLFNIKTLDTPNDYHMLQEAISRRQNHPEWGKPDLIIIDGGRGQLRSSLSAWHWPTPIISIVKNPDRIIIPTQIQKKPRLSLKYQFILLPQEHPVLHLIQRIRDESHRFSKKQHLKRRTKNMLS